MNDNKIITTEDGEEINLTALEREFGSYKVEGKTYYAARQMEYTNRVFPGSYADKYGDGSFFEEWSAPGYDAEGNMVDIYMVFEQMTGEEIEGENLNWTQDASRVEAH